MTVDVNSEDGLIIRKLIPLATLPSAQFNALCVKIAVEVMHDGFLFEKGDSAAHLIYLIKGQVTLQSAGLVVDVITASSESARFALAGTGAAARAGATCGRHCGGACARGRHCELPGRMFGAGT